jgi:ABC-type multidrug transport system fused ATPase/permease subunit
MSVAKPILEYVSTIRIQASLSRSTTAFRQIIRYHRPYLRFFVLIGALSLLRAYMFILEPLYTTQIIDQVIVEGNYDQLQGLVLKIVLVTVALGILSYTTTYVQGYTAQVIERDLRSDYYDSLQYKSFRFYDTALVGDLVSRATNDLRALEQFLKGWVGTLTSTVFTVVLAFAVMYSINPTMSLIALAPMILVFYLATRLRILVMPLVRKMNLILGRLGAYVQQNIIGMKVVRIFGRETEMEDGFKQVEAVYVKTAINAGRIGSRYTPSAQAILTLGITFIYVYGGNLIAAPSSILTIGQLTLFSRYMMRTAQPLRELSMLVGWWVNASVGLERVNQIMEMPVDIKDGLGAKEIPITHGLVEFKNVDFGYSKERTVLKGISFTAKPGERIAILGPTGSGKTTLIYLIPRFYDVSSGSILIDGIDVRDFKLSSLRRQTALVMQDVFIFTGTIRDNIAFGRPQANKDEIIRASKLARIHDFIETLPEGYDTIVGERGVTLSGGQRQRLTIARALITDPKILILDDSLSFVDAKTEQEIQEAIEEAMRGRTCFIIAQRLSTIKNADRVMVLDNGEIAEFGTHSELIANGGLYRRVYETQFLEKAAKPVLRAEVK